MTLHRVVILLIALTVMTLLLVGGGIVYGLLDIAFSQADDRRGILTNRAIEAVRHFPEGDAHIEDAIAAQDRQSTWHAYHGDDDSLRVVVVTVSGWPDPRLAPQWCVQFGFDWQARGFRVRSIAPINRAAQEIAPTLGSQFRPLDPYGTSYCAGMADRNRIPNAIQ